MKSILATFLLLLVFILGNAPAQSRQFVVDWPQPRATADTPTASLPAPSIPWLTRVETNIDKLKDGPYDLIFDGDSITDNWQTGAPDIWKQYYGSIKALDIGIGGDQVQNLIWRVQNGSLAGQDPKLIVVMIGTNNTAGGTPAAEIVSGIQALLKEYETRCPHSHILLLGVFPRGFTPSDPGRLAVGAINKILAETKFDERITYLDFGSQFLEPDGTILPTMMGDGLHPGPKGYAIWAKAIQPVVDRYVMNATSVPAAHDVKAAIPGSPRKISFDWPQALPPAGTPMTCWPVPRIDWVVNFETNIDKLEGGPYELVFDGDQTAMALAYQPMWKQIYEPLKALNLGTWWDQVQNVTWRVQNGSLASQHPKLIVVETGIFNQDQPAKEVAAGIKLLMESYQKQCLGSHILLLGIFPRNPSPTDPTRVWVNEVNKILSTYAGPKVTFLDIGSKFLEPDGTISKSMMPDAANLSPDGYAVWVKEMQPVIDQYVGAAQK